MYLTKDFSYWDLVTSFFKKDEECFELFKSKAKEKGYEICAVQITMVKDSYYARTKGDSLETVPYLRIYVNGEENFEKVKKENINQGLVNQQSEIILRDLWLEVCKEKNLDLNQMYNPDMYVGVGRVEDTIYTYFARKYKPQIQTIIENVIGCTPRDLYACSIPGVNIVFEQDIYERYQVAEKEKELEEKIKDLAVKTVKAITDGAEVKCNLHVKCWHPKMQGYSGYGLARED